MPETVLYLLIITSIFIGFYVGFGDPTKISSSITYGVAVGLAIAGLAWSFELQSLVVIMIGIASALLLTAVHRNYSPTLPARKQRYGGPWGW